VTRGLEMPCTLSAINTTTSGCSRRAPSKRAHVRVCLDSTFSTLPLLTTIATEVLHELEARKGPSSFATSPSASTGVLTSSCLCVCVCASSNVRGDKASGDEQQKGSGFRGSVLFLLFMLLRNIGGPDSEPPNIGGSAIHFCPSLSFYCGQRPRGPMHAVNM
jgi:hypothetical protein